MTSRESEDLAPLDADIASMLASEKPIAVHHVAHVAAAFAATQTAIAGLGAGGGGSGGETGGSGSAGSASAASPIATGPAMGAKVIATAALTFVLGTVVGGVAVYSTIARPETRAPSSSVVAPEVERATAQPPNLPRASASTSEAAPLSVMELPTAKPAASVAKIAPAEPDVLGNGARGLAAERALLDVARAGLARGAPNETLDATSRHARDYAQGVLAEEREALAIKALVATARVSEARARAARFKARFPKSLLLPAIESAVRAEDAG